MTCTALGTPSMESPPVSGWGMGTRLPAFTLPLSLFFPCQPPPKFGFLVSKSKACLPPLLPSFFPPSFHVDLGTLNEGRYDWIPPFFHGSLPPPPTNMHIPYLWQSLSNLVKHNHTSNAQNVLETSLWGCVSRGKLSCAVQEKQCGFQKCFIIKLGFV